MAAQPEARWKNAARHSLDDLRRELAVAESGLTQEEAGRRLQSQGRNIISAAVRKPWYKILPTHFIHFFALLLWVAALLSFLAGMPSLAVAIAAVVLLNGAFSFWQEFQAEKAMEALEAMLPVMVRAQRDGLECEIPAEAVVVGDLVFLRAGDLIPADARIAFAEDLRVDLSSLTGESRSVACVAAPTAKEEEAALPANIVFAGTSVAEGTGRALVFATGKDTEFGRIAWLTARQRERPSPLERELQGVTRVVTLLAVGMGISFGALGVLAMHMRMVDAFLFAIGVIVANVPEGLLPTLTLSLAMAVRRLARREALVRRLSAVEALGATTVILTDKTGTLTENRMAVRAVWAPGAEAWQAAAPEAQKRILLIAALCSDNTAGASAARRVQEGTDAAIWKAALIAGNPPDLQAALPRVREFAFDSARKRMTTVHRQGERLLACVKGAPEEILARCRYVRSDGADAPLPGDALETSQRAYETLARKGFRVLAVASRELPPAMDDPGGLLRDETEKDLTLLGYVGFEDPPRASVPAALRACRSAGIRVHMVTGDSGLTGAAIALEIGMGETAPRVVTGRDLDGLDDPALDALLTSPDLLFARVKPEHKLRLVEAFQRLGEVVAVTGDGVNDAPALKQADIGVAMGKAGTEVARAAADMVLRDDDFGTIVTAVQEGRTVYDNVRKFVTYIFASNVSELVPFLAFALFRIPLPLNVMQILAVDLGTDMAPALALGMESAEPDVMTRPPRSRKDRLLNPGTLLRAYAWLGGIQAVFCLGGFFYAYWLSGWRPGMPMAAAGMVYKQAVTLSLAGIVACQIGNVFACRSSRYSVFSLKRRNPWIWGAIVTEMTLVLLLIHVRPLAGIFGLAPLQWRHWALLACYPFVFLLMEEGRKLAMLRWRRARSPSPGEVGTLSPLASG